MIPSKPAPARLASIAAAAAALLLLPCACRRSAPPPRVVDRVHDLVALLDEAEVSDGSPYALRPIATISPDDPRDRIAVLRVPTGTSITWPSLATRAEATLSFGIGVTWPDEGGDAPDAEDVPVTFVVTTSREGGPTEEVFRRTVRPGELPQERLVLPVEVSLPGTGAAARSLTFATSAPAGRSADWPGFFSPRIDSDGRPSRADEEFVRVDDLVLDLVGGLGAAEVVAQPDDAPVVRTKLDAAVGVAGAGGARVCVRAAAPSRVRYRVRPPAGAVLAFSFGMDTETGWSMPGDGMTFAVEVDGDRRFERTLAAPDVVADRGWFDAEVDLSPFVDREVTLDLVTEPRGDAAHDVGGFAEARVVRERHVPRRRADEGPTVIVLLVDTLRADGVGEGRTPRLDAVAARGVRFADARTVTPWTWPTVATLFTGLYPHEHGVHSGEGFVLVDAHDTLAERFQRAGYTTGAFVTNLLIGAVDRFDQGFETFVHTPYARARALNDRLLAWLDDSAGLARFAYVHAFDPHAPYLPPPPFLPEGVDRDEEEALARRVAESHAAGNLDEAAVREWMALRRALYDAEVAYFDVAFGELMDGLAARGVTDDLLLVFTSDHGEEFYEHGLIDHGYHLFDESVRVPLFVVGFGRSALAPRVVETPVELRGVLRTLARRVGLDGADDDALGPDLLGARLPDVVFGHADKAADPAGSGELVELLSALKNEWKLIHAPASGHAALYDLETDPGEQVDRAGDDPAIRDRLLDALRAWRAECLAGRDAARVAADDEALRRMEQMGYVGRGR